MGESHVNILVNVLLDKVEDREAAKTCKHSKVFVDVNIDSVEVLVLFLLVSDHSLIGFASASLRLLFESLLNFDEPFKIIADNFEEGEHFLNVLI